jgi:hypothetical protein
VVISNGELDVSEAEPLATIYCLDPTKRVTVTQYRLAMGQPLDPGLVQVIDGLRGKVRTGTDVEPKEGQ